MHVQQGHHAQLHLPVSGGLAEGRAASSKEVGERRKRDAVRDAAGRGRSALLSTVVSEVYIC